MGEHAGGERAECNATFGTLANLSTALGVTVKGLLSEPCSALGIEYKAAYEAWESLAAGPFYSQKIGHIGRRSSPIARRMVARRMITEEDVRQRLRTNVRARRIAASLTVKAAAALAKMNLRHWQKIESGEVNVTLQTLDRLAMALGCEAADLIAEPAPRPPPLT